MATVRGLSPHRAIRKKKKGAFLKGMENAGNRKVFFSSLFKIGKLVSSGVGLVTSAVSGNVPGAIASGAGIAASFA